MALAPQSTLWRDRILPPSHDDTTTPLLRLRLGLLIQIRHPIRPVVRESRILHTHRRALDSRRRGNRRRSLIPAAGPRPQARRLALLALRTQRPPAVSTTSSGRRIEFRARGWAGACVALLLLLLRAGLAPVLRGITVERRWRREVFGLLEGRVVEEAELAVVSCAGLAVPFPLVLLEAFGVGGQHLLVGWESWVGFVH